MRVMRPHKIWSYGKAVSGDAPATNYLAAWASDAQLNTPFKHTTTGGAVTLTGAVGQVDLIVIANHNLRNPATLAISGSVSSSIVIPAARPNNIPYNHFVLLGSPVSVTTLTFTVAANPTAFIVGEFIAGLSETWDLLSDDNTFEYNVGTIEHEDIDVSSVPNMDLGYDARAMRGSDWGDKTDKEFLDDWLAGTLGNTRPSIIIPNETDNDAWGVLLTGGISGSQKIGEPNRLYKLIADFKEIKRHRW